MISILYLDILSKYTQILSRKYCIQGVAHPMTYFPATSSLLHGLSTLVVLGETHTVDFWAPTFYSSRCMKKCLAPWVTEVGNKKRQNAPE